MNFVTDLADLAVVLPLAVLIAIMTALAGWRRGARAWSVVFPAVCLCMLGSKILTFSHARLFAEVGLRSPSGHAAVAVLAYGGAFVLLAGVRPATALLIGAGAGVLIGATRMALGFHTLPDVIAGAVVGLVGLRVLVGLAGRCPLGATSPRSLVLLLVAAAGYAALGMHVPAEHYIWRLSRG